MLSSQQLAEDALQAHSQAWASSIAAQTITITAYARKGDFISPKACATHITSTKVVQEDWITEVEMNNEDVADVAALLRKYGVPTTIEHELIDRRHHLTISWREERFSQFGAEVNKQAGEMMAAATLYGSIITQQLRATYRDLLEEWICDVRQWDWAYLKNRQDKLITNRDGTPRMFYAHFRKTIEANEDLNPTLLETAILKAVSQHHAGSVYHMQGLGLLLKTEGWQKAGATIRALNIALTMIEERDFDHSGEIGSLQDVGTDRSQGSAWGDHDSEEGGYYIDEMSRKQNAKKHLLSRRRHMVFDRNDEWDAHDQSTVLQDEREDMLDARTIVDTRIVKVVTFDRAMFQQDVLMQDVQRGKEAKLAGHNDVGMSKLWDSKDSLTVIAKEGKKARPPRKDRNSYRTLMHQCIEDTTGFQLAMHRCVTNPKSWLPNANSGYGLIDESMTRTMRKVNDWIKVVSKRVPTPYGPARWMVIQYKSGYKALWLVFEISNVSKPHTVKVWDKDTSAEVDKTVGTPFHRYGGDWQFIGIQVTSDQANDVARSFGYQVDWYKEEKRNDRGDLLDIKFKPVWNVPTSKSLIGSRRVDTPVWAQKS